MDKKYLEWDYDYKEKLLGKENYKKASNPIKNILLAKDKENYENPEGTKGHIENYTEIDNILRKGFSIDDNVLLHKDIMNSFWTTYKFYLQLEYPAIFTPEGDLREESGPLTKPKSNVLTKVNIGYPPHTTESKSQSLNQKYIEYYREHFPSLLLPFQKEINEGKYPLWVNFLLKNFNSFDKVHQDKNLKKFARLTHTIGNIVIIPKGFNSSRGGYDYSDLALLKLEKTDKLKNFVDINHLYDYVDSNFRPLPLWKSHFSKGYLPTKKDDINDFLIDINKKIKNRGKLILDLY